MHADLPDVSVVCMDVCTPARFQHIEASLVVDRHVSVLGMKRSHKCRNVPYAVGPGACLVNVLGVRQVSLLWSRGRAGHSAVCKLLLQRGCVGVRTLAAMRDTQHYFTYSTEKYDGLLHIVTESVMLPRVVQNMHHCEGHARRPWEGNPTTQSRPPH